VGLVDGEERNAGHAQPLGRAAEVEALWRHVEQLDLPPVSAREAIRDLAGSQSAIYERRRQSLGRQRIDLILHQRDEWRDDDGEAGQ